MFIFSLQVKCTKLNSSLLGFSICSIFLIHLNSSFFSHFTYKSLVLQLSQVPQNIPHLHCPIHPCIHHGTTEGKGKGERLTESLKLSDLDVVLLGKAFYCYTIQSK